jgi:lysozyme
VLIRLLVFAGLLGLAALGYKVGWLWFVRPSWDLYPVRGIDVSHHQGVIDWRAVASEGWSFAWIKATEGGDWEDPRFEENRAGAAQAGVRWGAYHFFTFCRDPAEQASHFLAVVGNDPGPLPPALDLEVGGNCADQPSSEELVRRLGVFLNLVENRLQRRMILYLLPEQAETLFGSEGMPDRPLWLRSIFSQPAPLAGQPPVVWQYHSRAWVAGVGTATDLNAFLGDERAFESFLRDGSTSPSSR